MESATTIAKGIMLFDGRAISGFRQRSTYSSLGVRPKSLAKVKVYCEDGTIRHLAGYEDRKLHPPYSAVLFLNPVWIGKPVLSEPIGTYGFEDLRKEVRNRLLRPFQSAEAPNVIKRRIAEASTFDDLLDLVYEH